MAPLLLLSLSLLVSPIWSARPPGPGPFGNTILRQPVLGAPRGVSPDGWRTGKLCDITQPPFSANPADATDALQSAIDACGDSPLGGTVWVPRGVYQTGSLWLRSNLTFRVEKGATLLGLPNGAKIPLTYARRECVMMNAYAGFINGGRCLQKKSPLVGWDDCARWSKLENVVIEGGGTLDANAEYWLDGGRERPMMLDLMWINGLTIRDMIIRRPGFWTVHPTFCNNVVFTGNDVTTRGHNTDGIDPDSTWNMYIAHNVFDNGDDCIAIKSGRDWSGIMVNISTQNILVESNFFKAGHGISIGSETSGWVRNITIRNSSAAGTDTAVRVKSCRNRGGGAEDIIYEGVSGAVTQAIQLTLNYESHPPTNVTATPEMRNIIVRNANLQAKDFLLCDGLEDSHIEGVVFEDVKVSGSTHAVCNYCHGTATQSTPTPCFV